MSAPVGDVAIRCSIKGWQGTDQLWVNVWRGHIVKTFLVNIREARQRYPECIEMEAVHRMARRMFKIHVDKNGSAFTGYD